MPIAPQAADLFYGRLFEIAPGVRPLFPTDLTSQKQKLMAMLGTAVDQPAPGREASCRPCRTSGAGMSAYGVTDAHYQPVGEALIWTLDKGLGPAFTTRVKDAWVAAYTTLADRHERGRASARQPPRKGLFARMFG